MFSQREQGTGLKSQIRGLSFIVCGCSWCLFSFVQWVELFALRFVCFLVVVEVARPGADGDTSASEWSIVEKCVCGYISAP